jgi:hypothetical protein
MSLIRGDHMHTSLLIMCSWISAPVHSASPVFSALNQDDFFP